MINRNFLKIPPLRNLVIKEYMKYATWKCKLVPEFPKNQANIWMFNSFLNISYPNEINKATDVALPKLELLLFLAIKVVFFRSAVNIVFQSNTHI